MGCEKRGMRNSTLFSPLPALLVVFLRYTHPSSSGPASINSGLALQQTLDKLVEP